jgi:hypothetical protein
MHWKGNSKMGASTIAANDLLARELDRWKANRLIANFWWRDDDAQFANDAFKRLTDLAGSESLPLVLAVSPMLMTDGFVARLNSLRDVSIAAHGYRHINHATAPLKGEFGPDRSLEVMRREIEELAGEFAVRFPNRGIAMFVPPWHGLDPRLVSDLARVGFKVLSMFESRVTRGLGLAAGQLSAIGLALPRRSIKLRRGSIQRLDCSVSVLSYEGGNITGNRRIFEKAVRALSARRLGFLPVAQPIGILTHHLLHDEDAWKYLSQILTLTARHPAVRYLPSEELSTKFGPSISNRTRVFSS